MTFNFLLFLLFIFFPSPTQAYSLLYNYCSVLGGTYPSNSTFESNLNDLLSSSLTSAKSTFNTSTQGSIPDLVYGLFLCRGDVSPSDCHACIETATENATQLCPSYEEVSIFYDDCQLRYSGTSFFGTYDNGWQYTLPRESNASDQKTFGESEKDLLNSLSKQAAYNSSYLKFATGELVYSDHDGQEIFGMVQCTRDLSTDDCYLCLQQMFLYYWRCCEADLSGGVLSKSCNFRYHVKKFFNGEPTVKINRSYSSSSSSPALAPSPLIPLPPHAPVPTGEDNGKGIPAVFCFF